MLNPSAAAAPQADAWTLPSRGRVGMLCLISTESALFIIFVIAYLFYIGKSLSGPFPAQVLHLPIAATVCLLSSSISITIALRALRRQQARGFHLWWLVTILLGLFFLGSTGLEWYGLIYKDGLTISTNLFGTTYYSLVGFHAGHVTVGLGLLTLVLVLSVRGHVKPAHTDHVEVLSWYWHFVDVVWVVVFTTVYIIGR